MELNMKVLFFLILSLPLTAFAYRVDYNCVPQIGRPYGLALGSSSNEFQTNGAMGAYLKGNSCNGEGQCVFVNSGDSKVEYWVNQADYDASQVYNQCLSDWQESHASDPTSRRYNPECDFTNLPETMMVTEKSAGEITSYTQCVRRDIGASVSDPQN